MIVLLRTFAWEGQVCWENSLDCGTKKEFWKAGRDRKNVAGRLSDLLVPFFRPGVGRASMLPCSSEARQ